MTTGARTATVYGSLQAFLPGVLALGGDLERARRLQESGFRMWTLHGVEPEELDYRTMAVTDASATSCAPRSSSRRTCCTGSPATSAIARWGGPSSRG